MSLSKAIVLFALFFVPILARFDLNRRLICVQDDLYTGFHNAPPEDIDPWCSSYLGLQDVESTSNAYTSRTTTVTTTTTYTPWVHATTIPDYIATITTTIGDIRKRTAAPVPTPAVQLDQLYSAVPDLAKCDESAANKSVISAVSSGCSCLFVMPRTIPVFATTTSTRTETAVDYEASNIYTTETGYSTLTVTVLPTPFSNSTFSGPTGALSTGFPDTHSSSYISGSPAPSPNISVSSDERTNLPSTTPVPVSSGFPPFPPANSSSSVSSLPTLVPSNNTATASTNSAPTSTPTLQPFSVCPARDKQIITESDGEQFRILCYTNFTGPTTTGLDEPTYGACVQQCALDNDGFSAIRCYGVSYFPNQIGPNCYLKTKAGVANPDYNPDYRIVSALLILNGTNTTSSSISPSASPTGASSSTGSSVPASSSPTLYPNITNSGDRNGPTGMPSSSSETTWPHNYTSTPGPTAPPSSSNSTVPTTSSEDLWPYPTNTTSKSGPTAPPSSNSTAPTTSSEDLWPYPTNTTSKLGPTAPPTSSNSSASITPSNSFNSTAYPSITPTPSYNVTSTPSGFPTAPYNYTTPIDNSTATTDPRNIHPYPTNNASICYSTDWITAYTTECSSTLYITSWTSATSHSATTTVTQIFTLTV